MISKDKWYNKFDESSKRQYFPIEDYKVKIPGEAEPTGPEDRASSKVSSPLQKSKKQRAAIQSIISTEKHTECDGSCCKASEPVKNEEITRFGQLQP